MKKKLLGIFVCMLLIATALPAVGTMTEKEFPARLGMGDNFLSTSNTPRNIMSSNRDGMFIQLPYLPDYPGDIWEWASHYIWQIFEDFWEIPSPICDIHWWGEYLLYEGGVWYVLDPELMRVNISFYEDDNGQPGALVSSYIDVKPSVTSTGLWYDFGDPFLSQLYYFEYDLDPCVILSEGWVSISSVQSSDNGWLLWITSPDGNGKFLRNESGNLVTYLYDVALVLTDGEPADPDLECDGELSWTDISPGATVTGDFVVRNNGAPDSILHWKIESYPTDWGTNWTFTPNASILTIGAGWITVDVEVIAPDDPNEEFTGEVKLVNVLDPSNSCTIDVSLATPRNRAFNINLLFLRFLEQHPHMFPILRHMLGF